MYHFPIRRYRAETLGSMYEGHEGGLGTAFFYEPIVAIDV
jgi:hypothetical protein